MLSFCLKEDTDDAGGGAVDGDPYDLFWLSWFFFVFLNELFLVIIVNTIKTIYIRYYK